MDRRCRELPRLLQGGNWGHESHITSTRRLMLTIESVSKHFPGVRALHNVSFEVVHGEVHALIGENGAGKSTLMKILSGVYTDYEGEVLLDGQPLTLGSPRDAQRRGIGIIHQELNLIPELTVAENIFLGREPRTAAGLLGVTMIYISHKFDEIFRIADRVTVLRDGECIGTRSIAEVDQQSLIRMMVGRSLSDLFPKEIATVGDEALRVEHLSLLSDGRGGGRTLNDISFNVRRGEILGIAGLMGAGRTELLETLY